MDKGIKAGIYARVSTKDQNTDNQIINLKSYCLLRGWSLINVYEDVISGKKGNRPGLNRLRNDIKDRSINLILVYKLDRLGRSTRDLLDQLEFIRSHNCAFVSYSDNIDITTPMGKMVYTFLSAVAEFEANLISERTKLAYKTKKAQANNLGYNPIWGRKAIVISTEEYEIIKAARAKGTSWRKIEDLFNTWRVKPGVIGKDPLSHSTLRRLFQKGGA